MFKIDSLKLSETTEMLLKHPATGEVLEDEKGKPVVFTLCGTASREYQKAVDVLVRKKKQRNGREATHAESRADSIEFVTSLTKKVDNMNYPDGVALDNPEAIKALYTDESLSWIRDQVNSELNSVEAFLKQSAS
jgi:hypothetical protein